MFPRAWKKKLVYSMMVNDNFHKSAMILTTHALYCRFKSGTCTTCTTNPRYAYT
jgi:hypothetical protein